MKQNKKELGKRKYVVVLLIVLLCIVSACSLDRFYYANDRDPVGTIVRTFGDPLWVEAQQDGAEKLVYILRDPMDMIYYHRYFIVKDGKVTGGGIER
ncbi:MAG TPA: hypothetical protein VLZ07_10510 [Syntrophales bacterium]|nr:hypothetical protein [Syntrophales bacterium]